MSSKKRLYGAFIHFSPQFSPHRLFFSQNRQVGLGHLLDQVQDPPPLLNPSPTRPHPPGPPLFKLVPSGSPLHLVLLKRSVFFWRSAAHGVSAAAREKLAEDAALTTLIVVEVSEVVLGAARGCQFPLNLTNLACDIVESTLDDAPVLRATQRQDKSE
jgi:hypothetical protein